MAGKKIKINKKSNTYFIGTEFLLQLQNIITVTFMQWWFTI